MALKLEYYLPSLHFNNKYSSSNKKSVSFFSLYRQKSKNGVTSVLRYALELFVNK